MLRIAFNCRSRLINFNCRQLAAECCGKCAAKAGCKSGEKKNNANWGYNSLPWVAFRNQAEVAMKNTKKIKKKNVVTCCMCVPKKKTQLRGKLKLKMPGEGRREKLQTAKGNFGLHVACCILPNMKFHMHILKMPQPSTCGSHVAANGIHESVCVSKGAETNAFSRNFIHKDFILLYIVQLKATTRRRTAGRPKAKRTERQTDGQTRPGQREQHENKDLLPLNMDSPRPWHVQEVCRNCR